MRYILFFLIALQFLWGAEPTEERPVEVFKSQRMQQGEIFFEQSQKYFDEKMYKSCIEKSLDFLILFPKHPLKLANLKLLSEAYLMNDQWEKSIQVDLKIHREFPTIEDGISSYLQAARKMIRIGRRAEATRILERIKSEMFSYKLAKEAEIELNQLKILYETSDFGNEGKISPNEKIFSDETNKTLLESDK
jgi:hypothetical protein